MRLKKYYVPVGPDSIGNYFKYGCIKPQALLERIRIDTQSPYNYGILLSPTMWVGKDLYSLEVLVDENELEVAERNEGFLLFFGIIPISRVRAIHVKLEHEGVKEKTENFIWDINNGAAFLPERLFIYCKPEKTHLSDIPLFKKLEHSTKVSEIEKLGKKYDRLLGGLAFFKTALIDFSDKEINYPSDYLATAGFFNPELKALAEKFNLKENQTLLSYFSRSAPSPILKYLGKDINEEHLLEVSKQEGFKLSKRLGIWSNNGETIDRNSQTFLMWVLQNYATSRSKSKSEADLLNGLFQELTPEKRQEVALIMGINTGYGAFYNNYKAAGKEIDVKYRLDSPFDYLLLESIYNYVRPDGLKTTKLADLEPILNDVPNQPTKPLSGYLSYNVFGTRMVIKKKDDSLFFDNVLDKITTWVSSWFPFEINAEQLKSKLKEAVLPVFKEIAREIREDAELEFKQKIEEQNELLTEMTQRTGNEGVNSKEDNQNLATEAGSDNLYDTDTSNSESNLRQDQSVNIKEPQKEKGENPKAKANKLDNITKLQPELSFEPELFDDKLELAKEDDKLIEKPESTEPSAIGSKNIGQKEPDLEGHEELGSQSEEKEHKSFNKDIPLEVIVNDDESETASITSSQKIEDEPISEKPTESSDSNFPLNTEHSKATDPASSANSIAIPEDTGEAQAKEEESMENQGDLPDANSDKQADTIDSGDEIAKESTENSISDTHDSDKDTEVTENQVQKEEVDDSATEDRRNVDAVVVVHGDVEIKEDDETDIPNEEELKSMTLKKLQSFAEDKSIDYKKSWKRPKLITSLLSQLESAKKNEDIT